MPTLVMHPPIRAPLPGFADSVLRAVRWALPHLMLATIAAGLAGFIAQSWITPRYQVEATLTIGNGKQAAIDLSGHIKALGEADGVLAVAKALDVQSWPEFGKPNQSTALLGRLGLAHLRKQEPVLTADEQLLTWIYRRLQISAGTQPNTILVKMTAADSALAAQFVNRLLGDYLRAQPVEAAPMQVAEWAEADPWPIYPRKGAAAMLGMATILLLGLGWIVTREAVRTVRRRPDMRSEREGVDVAISPNASRFMSVESVGATARRMFNLADPERGFRTIVAGDSASVDPSGEALRLAIELSEARQQVVLVRWSLAGGGVIDASARPGMLGINDLVLGAATFENVITRLANCRVHAIAAGSPATDAMAALDPDRLNLVLDTLDEVYDHIIVLAEHDDARMLFEAMEGRFDACVSVSEPGNANGALSAGVDLFLGYEVTDIDIIELARPVRQLSRARLQRAA